MLPRYVKRGGRHKRLQSTDLAESGFASPAPSESGILILSLQSPIKSKIPTQSLLLLAVREYKLILNVVLRETFEVTQTRNVVSLRIFGDDVSSR